MTETVYSVLDYYTRKNIFLTGGSGFIGKVLIEKLLRTCSTVEKIYVLLRPSKDGTQNAQQRLNDLLSKSKLFTFHKDQLDLSKVVPISGDLTKPMLGMSLEDRQLLIDNVNVVFHSAATVRFHGPLNDFITQNVFGTDMIMKLCQEMKYLQSVVYVSTAYANCNLWEVEEKVYPLGTNKIDTLIEEIQTKTKPNCTPKVGEPVLMGRPNSYTLSKAIAECLVEEKYSNLPVVICRPSIVTYACYEPVEGWCDSFNGLAGTLTLGGLGIARTMKVNCEYKADIIPVDFVVNSLIVIGAHTAYNPVQHKRVVHITSGTQNPITWGEILDFSRMAALEKPSAKLVRPIAKNPVAAKTCLGKINYLLTTIFSHYLFAYIFDLILLLTGHSRFMVRIIKKMHRAFDVLEHFTSREWRFVCQNYIQIFSQLETKEQMLFESNVSKIDWVDYCDSVALGTRRYLLNEDDSTIEKARKRMVWINIGYSVFKTIIYILIAVILLSIIIRPTIQNFPYRIRP